MTTGPWKEGDPVSPTNLNARTNVEGTEFSGTAYGVDYTGATDSYTAGQNLLDAIATNVLPNGSIGGGTWRTVPGTVSHSKPFWLKIAGTRIIGPAQGSDAVNTGLTGATKFVPSYAYGPSFLIAGSTASVPGLTTSLLTGAGQAWQPTTSSQYFNLRDCGTLDVNGLTALTVRCTYKPASVTGNAALVVSGGHYFNTDTQTNAFALFASGSAINFYITTTSGGLTTLAGGTLVAGNTYDVDACWDGTTVRLFVNGVQVASAAKSGTLVQQIAEDVPIGISFGTTPEASQELGPPLGPIDAIEVADVARHTSAFTPSTSKPVQDTHTLIICNFEDQFGPFVRGRTKNGDAWLWLRQTNPIPNGAPGCEISGIAISGSRISTLAGAGGIFVGTNSNEFKFERIDIANSRYGIFVPLVNSFMWRMADISLNPNSKGRYGVMIGLSSGIGQIDTLRSFGFHVPIVSMGGGLVINNAYVQAEPADTYLGFLLKQHGPSGAVVVLNNCIFNTETGTNSSFLGAIGVGGFGSGLPGSGVLTNGCVFETGNSRPPVYCDTVDHVTFNTTHFPIQAGPTSVMDSHGTHFRAILFDNPHMSGAAYPVPLSNVAGTACINVPGKQLLSYATAPTFDCYTGSSFELPLGGPVTGLAVTNPTPGQKVTMSFARPGTLPSSITGLVAWYKADSLSLSDGSTVTTWTDSSGNGNTLSENTNPPTYKTNIISTKPIVRFDGVNTVLSATGVMQGLTAYTALAVLKPAFNASELTNRGAVVSTTRVAGTGVIANLFAKRNNASLVNLVRDDTTDHSTEWDNLTTEWASGDQVLWATTAQFSSGTMKFYNGGTEKGSQVVAVAAIPDAFESGTTLKVGQADGAYFSGGCPMDLAELMVFNSVLTTSDRQLMERYLGDRWSTQTVTSPSNVKGMGTVDTTFGKTSQQLFEVRSDYSLYAVAPMQTGM